LIATLLGLADREAVKRFVSSRDFGTERAACLELVRSLAGSGLDIWTKPNIREWRAKAAKHWWVPVWYLVFVERCGPREVAGRLRATEDWENVQDLARIMLQAAHLAARGAR
jgi:hypothetical protein